MQNIKINIKIKNKKKMKKKVIFRLFSTIVEVISLFVTLVGWFI